MARSVQRHDDSDDDRQVVDLLIRGFQVSRTIRLAADLTIADQIEPDAQRTVTDLAETCGVLPQPLLRAIRLLAAFGIFRIDADGNVAHTPRSLLLRTDAPNSLHYSARFWTRPGSWRAWAALDAALDGGIPHEVAWGVGRFDYLRDHPDEARIFDAFMANWPDDRHHAVAAAYDFSKAALIADIGGGNGEALRHVLARFPKARGIVFDREDVVAAIPPEGLAGGRIVTQGGNFFEKVPVGADIYLLIRVLHDFADEDVVRILCSCRTAIGPDGRLLIVEQILPPDPSRGRSMDYLVDMHMMAMFGSARERTEAEFRALLTPAGFDLLRVVPTASLVSILEAARKLRG
jgi:SAM-dependent methyltransferase